MPNLLNIILHRRSTSGISPYPRTGTSRSNPLGWSIWRPFGGNGGRKDWVAEARNPADNATVDICLRWIANNFPDAPPMLRIIDPNGGEDTLKQHPLLTLINKPNNDYSGFSLWEQVIRDRQIWGNAYLVKTRLKIGGEVTGLHWLARNRVTSIEAPDDGSKYITAYKVDMGNGEKSVQPSELIHFRAGLELDTRMGRRQLDALSMEISADNAAAEYTASILVNCGIPNVIISRTGETVDDPEGAKGLAKAFKQKFQRDKNGEPLVIDGPANVQFANFSPEQMALSSLREGPEAKIAAGMGLNSMVVNLPSGSSRNTFANQSEAKKSAYNSCLIPLKRAIASDLEAQLVDDFSDLKQLKQRGYAVHIDFDYSRVPELAEDQDSVYKRADTGYRGAWLTKNEARHIAGHPRDETPGSDETRPTPSATPDAPKDPQP